MTSSGKEKLYFFDFLTRQQYEDRQAFIIHFPANSGKTAFAKKLCNSNPGLVYLDLLERFSEAPRTNILNFGVGELKKHLLAFSFPPDIHTILVDNMDFLINTWSDAEKRNFVDWLRLGLRTPSVSPYTWIFIIQHDSVICRQELTSRQGESRILPMNAFYNI